MSADFSPDPAPSRRPAPPGARAWVALAAVAMGLVLLDLGGLDLWAPDEPRYAQVADELRAAPGGAPDLVLLRLGGEPYTQKPPLYFWLAAAFGHVGGGVDPLSARLPSALAALGALGVWAAVARRLFPGTAVAWWTAALLLTHFRFLHLARRAQLDVLLTLFEGLALLGFLAWRDAASPGARRRALCLLHGATALALLTKGPVGLLPWACFCLVLWREGRASEIRRLLSPAGVAVALAPVLLWIGASVALAPPGFFEAAVVDNLWSRFAAGTAHVRPPWYFLRQLPVEALPWSLLWPVAAWSAWRRRRALGAAPPSFRGMLLGTWVLIPLAFFSLSAGKRGLYMLPALPALCVALAAWLERARTTSGARRLVDGPHPALGLGVLVAGAAAAAGPWRPVSEAGGGAFDAGRAGLAIVAGLGVGAALVVTRLARGSTPPLAVGLTLVWTMVVAIWGVLLLGVLPHLEPEKSPRPIARAASAASRPGEPVGLWRQASLRGGLLYYGERSVRPLEEASELAAFRADGGRVIVARARDADVLEAEGAADRVATLRSGRRAQAVIVLTPRAPTHAGGARAAPDGEPSSRR